ncbi:dolichyl-diphosphooligosaccharide--protein glycosyltransferase subunit STT3 [Desulfovibrio mangrovi]|uniref:STT3 domain-containing protein n=1 Tax=Desulfovibrio mangrovi TaxID=2976983 RepID=UPI0022450983|nr:STT3 domain-containing protein [Desulfovibrio mangrovi]UZP67807.1 dolichyl-diphosphooligosaccharide--protein glycosyltransferase subunit STT3 [Desulfovibrio mangrovi]
MKAESSACDWKRILLYALIAYALSLGVRLLQPSPLPDGITMVDGEYLLGTHDAYNWLIRAIDPQTFGPHPMSDVTRMVVEMTRLSYERVAFWAPPVMASLVAVAVVCWAAVLGCAEMGMVAGVFTALCPGFLYRTTLGFYDTDLVMLLMPLVLTLAPAALLHGRILAPLEAWRARKGGEQGGTAEDAFAVPPLLMGLLLLSGIVGWQMQAWHVFFQYLSKIFPLIALVLVLLLGQRGRRVPLLTGLALYALPMGGGWLGTLFGILLLGLHVFPDRFKVRPLEHRYTPFILAAGIVLVGLDASFFHSVLLRINLYLKPVASDGQAARYGLKVAFPAVVQSVIEAQNMALRDLFGYLYPVSGIVVLGLLGFLAAVWLAPAAALLFPLLVLGLLSVKLGGRMIMFAAPAVGLGIALPLHYLLLRFRNGRLGGSLVRAGIACVVSVLLAVPIWLQLAGVPYVPFISAPHVQVLKAVEAETPADAAIWTWWDWGYATQFFTRKWTYSDGARHNSDRLYPTAAIYTTDSPRFANQLIKYIMNNGDNLYYAWKGKDAQEVNTILADLESRDLKLTLPRKQYLVVSMDSLKLGAWITRFGTWDFASKRMMGYNIRRLGQISADLDQGYILEAASGDSTPLALESADIIGGTGTEHRNYAQFPGIHLVLDLVSGTQFIMDSHMYNSMMVQLLLRKPDDPFIAPYFRLVHGNGHTRIFEVL